MSYSGRLGVVVQRSDLSVAIETEQRDITGRLLDPVKFFRIPVSQFHIATGAIAYQSDCWGIPAVFECALCHLPSDFNYLVCRSAGGRAACKIQLEISTQQDPQI